MIIALIRLLDSASWKQFIRRGGRACEKLTSSSTLIRRYLPYAFIVAGVVWSAIIASDGSLLLLWPASLSILSGVILKWRPDSRLSLALSKATALYGLVLAAYQVLVALPLLESIFATIALFSVVSFVGLAVFNLVLLYGSFPKSASK